MSPIVWLAFPETTEEMVESQRSRTSTGM